MVGWGYSGVYGSCSVLRGCTCVVLWYAYVLRVCDTECYVRSWRAAGSERRQILSAAPVRATRRQANFDKTFARRRCASTVRPPTFSTTGTSTAFRRTSRPSRRSCPCTRAPTPTRGTIRGGISTRATASSTGCLRIGSRSRTDGGDDARLLTRAAQPAGEGGLVVPPAAAGESTGKGSTVLVVQAKRGG